MKHYKLNTKTVAALSGWLAVVTFVFGCGEAVAGPPVPVTIVLNNYVTSLTAEGGTEVGVLTATGGLELVGGNTMAFRIEAGTLHCQVLFTDESGTISFSLQCQMVMTSEVTGGGPGRWLITHGTGAYKNLHGTGSLAMDFNLGVFPPTAGETMVGTVFYDNRN